jgi:acid phosphatase (class A)
MKKFPHIWLVLLLACTVGLQAKDEPLKPHYLDPTTIDLKTVLADPPADGSPETLKELALILDRQKTRTTADIARAESEVKLKVFVFADVLGPWFTARNLPLTAAFFQNVDDDSHIVSESAKKYWSRPRPPLQNKDIKPAVELPKTASYPSGHATRGELFARMLADLEPDLKDKIMARGQLIGDDRVTAGVHFPSDVVGGEKLGDFLYPKFTASPAYQTDLAKVKAELAAARKP